MLEVSIYHFTTSGQFTTPTADTGTMSGNSTAIMGTGGLAGISGTSHSESSFSPRLETSTYSGTMKFE